MEKSHVSVEQKVCKITGAIFDVGVILDRRLKNSLDSKTVTGWGISPEAQENLDKGFVAMVEIDHDKSEKLPDGNITPAGAYRLGRVVYVRKEVANEMFNVSIKEMCFVEPAVIDYLHSIVSESE